MNFRVATPADGGAIFDIYSYYIQHSTATFEITQLSPSVMEARIAHTLQDFPYLVCEKDGQILGYCYAHPLGEREAFRFGAELCIYLHPQEAGRGVGGQLYGRLMALLKKQGYCNVYGSITSENEGSLRFHSHLGFTQVGQISRAGYKFGRWLDLCWVAKTLQNDPIGAKPISFTKLDIKDILLILENGGTT